MIKITPLSVSACNWQGFIGFCKDCELPDPSKEIDKTHLKDKHRMVSFIGSLDTFAEKDVLDSIKDDINLNFGFMVFGLTIPTQYMPELLNISCNIHIKILAWRPHEAYLIVGGTLKQWKDTIIYGCSERVAIFTRKVFNEFYNRFSNTSVREVFSNYQRNQQPDSTFYLRNKK